MSTASPPPIGDAGGQRPPPSSRRNVVLRPPRAVVTRRGKCSQASLLRRKVVNNKYKHTPPKTSRSLPDFAYSLLQKAHTKYSAMLKRHFEMHEKFRAQTRLLSRPAYRCHFVTELPLPAVTQPSLRAPTPAASRPNEMNREPPVRDCTHLVLPTSPVQTMYDRLRPPGRTMCKHCLQFQCTCRPKTYSSAPLRPQISATRRRCLREGGDPLVLDVDTEWVPEVMRAKPSSRLSPCAMSSIALINAQSLCDAKKKDDLDKCANKGTPKLTLVSDTRCFGRGEQPMENGTIFTSGTTDEDQPRHAGVAIYVPHSMRSALIASSFVSDRLMGLKFSTRRGSLVVIVCYAPTDDSDKVTKDSFHAALKTLIRSLKGAFIVIGGDFNAALGHALANSDVLGAHARQDSTSDNGHRMLKLAQQERLSVVNTLFQHDAAHTHTWLSNADGHGAVKDYFLVNQALMRSVTDIVVHPTMPIASDHRWVEMSLKALKVKPPPFTPPPNKAPALNRGLLRTVDGSAHFRDEVDYRLAKAHTILHPDALPPLMPFTLYSYHTKRAVNASQRSSCKTKKRKCWQCSCFEPTLPAADRTHDGGYYCDKCWDQYDASPPCLLRGTYARLPGPPAPRVFGPDPPPPQPPTPNSCKLIRRPGVTGPCQHELCQGPPPQVPTLRADMELLKIKVREVLLPSSSVTITSYAQLEAEWSAIRDAIVEAQIKVAEIPRREETTWMSDVTLHRLEKRRCCLVELRSSPTPGNKERYTEADKVATKSVSRDLDHYWDAKASELEDAVCRGNTHYFYRECKRLHKGTIRTQATLKDADGNFIETKEEQRQRWTEHFTKVFDTDFGGTFSRNCPWTVKPLADLGAPTVTEVHRAIRRLKAGKAPGPDLVLAEALKELSPAALERFANFLRMCWTLGTVPSDFGDSDLIPLFKKGDSSLCDNYRGISLQSHAGKVVAQILLLRIQVHIESQMLPQQRGFRSGSSTMDHIFSHRQLLHSARESGAPLAFCFVDLKKAFDCCSRPLIMQLLCDYGVSEGDRAMIEALYRTTRASVRTGHERDAPFEIKNGVRQGCLLSSVLFAMFMDRIMREVQAATTVGLKVDSTVHNGIGFCTRGTTGTSLIQFMLFADDVSLVASSLEDLHTLLAAFEKITSQWGMRISADKTKWMATSSCTGDTAFSVADGAVKRVKDFKYLGSILSVDGSLDAELTQRMSAARHAWLSRRREVLLNHRISLPTRVRVFNTTVIPALTYGCEAWALTQAQEDQLSSFARDHMRQMCGWKWWQKHKNDELYEHTGSEPLSDLLRRARIRWLGHLFRKPPSEPERIMLSARIAANLPGGAHVSWTKRVATDLALHNSILGIRDPNEWTRIAHDRAKWQNFTRARQLDAPIDFIEERFDPLLPPGYEHAYVDGSCMTIDGVAVAGYGVTFVGHGGEKGRLRDVICALPGHLQTNNRAEILAAIVALQRCDFTAVCVHTDSLLVFKFVTMWRWAWAQKDFRGRSNVDLWRILHDTLECRQHEARFIKVRAHIGNVFNERADALAKAGASKSNGP